MPDFNKLLNPGDLEKGIVTTVVEIPEGSILKIEYRKKTGIFEIDRVEPNIFPKPANYGFIPQTLDEDNDELDTLIVCRQPIPTGVYLQAKVLGILNFSDDGEMDHKIVCVPADNRDTGDSISSLQDLGKRWQEKVEYHFNHYKDLKKPDTTKVLGWGSTPDAIKIIQECITRYQTNTSK